MARYTISRDDYLTKGCQIFTDAVESVVSDGGGYIDVLDPGVYELTGPIYAPANTVITIGAGVVLKRVGGTYLIRNNSSGCLNYSAPGNIHVRGEGILDVNSGSITGTDGAGAIAFVQCSNVSVEGISIRGVRNWHAVEYQAVKGGRIEKVTATDFTSAGGGWMAAEAFQLDINSAGDFSPCSDISITGCTAIGYGKLVGSHASLASKPQANIRITNNYVEGSYHYAVGGENWRYVTVTGNTFISCNGAVQMSIPSLDDAGSEYTSHNKGFVVSGNVGVGLGNQNGYQYKMAAAVDFLSYSTAKHSNIVVSGNNFQGTNTYGARTVNATACIVKDSFTGYTTEWHNS